MNAATILALVGVTAGLMVLGIIANELRLIKRAVSTKSSTVALLPLDEYEFEYYTRDRDEWDAQAYRMYMEEV